MRDFTKIIKHTRKWEGGYVKDANDSGGATNAGITYQTWCRYFGFDNKKRFFKMSNIDWLRVYNEFYYQIRGDEIKSDSIAFFATQLMWGSGKKRAVLTLQRACNELGCKLKEDSILGNATISAINGQDEFQLFEKLFDERKLFFRSIILSNPKNQKFYKGWMRRLYDFNITFSPK